MTTNDEKRICDRCDHFRVSPGGCIESCGMVRTLSTAAHSFQPYAEERINGEKQSCKEFSKIYKRF